MATKAVTKTEQVKNGLLPTPPMPKDLPKANLTDNARQVLMKRYVRRGDDGKPAETVEEMFWRVAYHVAKVEALWDADIQERTIQYYHLLSSKKFFPNSPTFTGAGTPLGQLAACFTAQMRVTTDLGVKPISQLEIGDRVLTHEGRYRPVTELFQRAYDGELLNVKIKLIGTSLEVTPEHPVLTENGWVKAGELRVGDRVAIGSPDGVWAAPVFDLAALQYAGDLELQVTDDSVRVRRPSTYQNSGRQAEWVNRSIALTPELTRLCGYYVAEGTISTDQRYVRFTFAKDEVEYHQDVIHLVETIFGARVNRSDSSFGNWINLNVYSRSVAAWFSDHFGKGSTKKRIPVWLQYAEREIQDEFLIGVMRGDGLYFEKTYVVSSRPNPKLFRSLRLTLSNPGLVQQIWQMCLRLGYDAAIRPVDTTYVTPNASDTAQISMPPLQTRELVKQAFGVDLPAPDTRYLRNKVTRDDRHVYFEIESIESRAFNGTVYNCEVDEDHTYVTEGVVVHNCFVLPITDDMGRHSAGIFQTLRDAALIQQTGGGNGFSFSRLRPHGAMVQTSAGQATGPVGFLRVYDHAFGEIAQGGTRRGANMSVLRVDHPDVEEFIVCKINENQITNFNISVGITDAFMRAVKNDEEWELRFPDLKEMKQKGFSGTLEQAETAGITIHVYKKVKARELFDKIVKQAHHNGEPGVLFLDAANRSNPVPHLYPLEATNPCFIGSTRIATDLGLLTIQELAENETTFMVANDQRVPQGGFGDSGNSRGVVYRASSPAWKTRENVQTFRLRTKHGYSVTATADHKFLTKSRGYVELGQLKENDELLLQSGEGVWSRNSVLPNVEYIREKMSVMARGGDHASGHTTTRSDFAEQYANLPKNWSHELGVVVGAMVGDGWLSPSSNSPVGMVFNYENDELLNTVQQTMQTYFHAGHLHERGSVRQLTYGRLPYEFFSSLGVLPARAHEKRVPSSVWSAPREAVVGFLQGLFTTDGTVNVSSYKKSCSIRLASSSVDLLCDVQMLLLNFGIVSRIHKRREAGLRNMPDGKGGMKEYFTQADYELIVDKVNRDKFVAEIGFLDSAKQSKVQEFISNKTRTSNAESFETTIVSIEDAGYADVYDLTEPQTHSVIANGIVAHQCGEQWLGPYENCCLGSVNLNEHCGPDGTVDWELLRESVVLSTRFLDDVVEANAYVPAVPQLTEAAHKARRIGLGIMGLADLMYHVGVRYGSKEGQEFGAQVMEFVRYHAMVTSVELARERGAFPAIEGSIYDKKNMKWAPPQTLVNYQNNWNKPPVEWDAVVDGIRTHGIRNAAQTTVAPTGTIATVAGCEGYGCEPVFALAYIRHVNDNGKDLKLAYASPRFDEALKKLGLGEEKRQEIVEQVMREGTCQHIKEIPQAVRDTFVVSADITADEHVRMQGALQAFVDNSLSKTVNFPEGATEADVATAYMLAWDLGCKGITVYVTGSRDKVVLETNATADKKTPPQPQPTIDSAPKPDASSAAAPPLSATFFHDPKKPRPRALTGKTYNVETPVGKAFITINENGGEQPFEAFINTAKAGSETAAVSEAIGRLISYILRMTSTVKPTDRMREIVRQLIGIGGGRSLGFGPNRVRSLPDGIGQVLDTYLREKDGMKTDLDEKKSNGNGGHTIEEEVSAAQAPKMKIGDLCPECGEAAVVNEEGCRKCYACGFSEC